VGEKHLASRRNSGYNVKLYKIIKERRRKIIARVHVIYWVEPVFIKEHRII